MKSWRINIQIYRGVGDAINHSHSVVSISKWLEQLGSRNSDSIIAIIKERHFQSGWKKEGQSTLESDCTCMREREREETAEETQNVSR